MIEKKVCTKCNIIKNICDFTLKKRSKDGYNCWCKSCANEYGRKYRKENAEKIKEYRTQNRDRHNELTRKWHEEHKEYEKKYRERTKEHRKAKKDIWYKKTIDKRREWHRNYRRRVRQNELIYMKDRIRNMISHSFRRKGYTKRSKTFEILGAEYDIVWEHLKNTWYSNYGTDYNGEDYEIDHIKPLSLANTEGEIIKLCHYSNLQLLTPEDNLKKSNNII